MAFIFNALGLGGGGAPKVANRVSAVTPPALQDPNQQAAQQSVRAAAARAMGRQSTVATGPQGDTSGLVTKKTTLGGS